MKKCLKCNAMYDDGVNYCTKCGSELVSDEKDQAEVNQNKNKFLKKKIMLPIVITVAIILFVVVGVIIFGVLKNSESQVYKNGEFQVNTDQFLEAYQDSIDGAQEFYSENYATHTYEFKSNGKNYRIYCDGEDTGSMITFYTIDGASTDTVLKSVFINKVALSLDNDSPDGMMAVFPVALMKVICPELSYKECVSNLASSVNTETYLNDAKFYQKVELTNVYMSVVDSENAELWH